MRSSENVKRPTEDQELVAIYQASQTTFEDKRVTIAKWCMIVGETDPAVRGRIRTGKWVEGNHFVRKGRIIRLNYKACLSWYDDNKAY